MTLTIKRSKWLRGSASHMMTDDGCGCVIGHYLVAKGVPKDILKYHYGFVDALEPFAGNFSELGEFVDDGHEGEPCFISTPECDELIEVNDGALAPVLSERQQEAVLIRLMKTIGCRLRFVSDKTTGGAR